MVAVKICGLSDPFAVTAAINNGAKFAGFVFHPPSPRNIDPDVAAYLVKYVPETVQTVGLFVDPTNELLQQILQKLQLKMLQLHGTESPARVAEIRNKFGLPVMKAIPVSAAKDVEAAAAYEHVADWLLFDTKHTTLPGGTGQVFDWKLLQQFKSSKPWMLAGGLNAGNIRDALAVLKPDALDVSSGVESAPGHKDLGKIAEFLKISADS